MIIFLNMIAYNTVAVKSLGYRLTMSRWRLLVQQSHSLAIGCTIDSAIEQCNC